MSSGWLASPTWTQRSLMKTEHTRETLMLMIRQFPELVSKLPGISAYTLFVRAYCSFLKGEKKGEGRFPSACHANFAAWRESGFVLSITRITERFEKHDLHSQKRKLSLLSSCPAAWVLYWHRTKPGSRFKTRWKQWQPLWSFGSGRNLTPSLLPQGNAMLCSQGGCAHGPPQVLTSTSGLEAGFKPGFTTFHPARGSAAWGRQDTCDGVIAEPDLGTTLCSPSTGRPRDPRSAQTLRHNTEAFKIVWVFCLVGFCCWLSPSNHQMLK